MQQEKLEIELKRNSEKYESSYSEDGFFRKIKQLVRRGGLKAVVYAFVLYYTLKAPTTPPKVKFFICLGLGYLIVPFDLIPDFILGFGYSDDLLVLELVLFKIEDAIMDYVTPSVLKQAIEATRRVFKDEPIEHIKEIINQMNIYEPIN